MRHKIISISKAKAKLLELARRTQSEGEAYLLVKDGEPISALVPLEDYDALNETSEILQNTQDLKNLKQALLDEHHKRLWKRDTTGKWIKVSKKRRAV